MMGKWKWDAKAGDDEALVFTFQDNSFDSARSWKAQVRRYAGLTDTPEAECGIAASASALGKQMVAVSLSAAQTRALRTSGIKRAAWDLQLVEGGLTTTVLGGVFDLDPDVTR